MKKFEDVLLSGGTNAGKELEVYCDKDFLIESQLQFFNDIQNKYCPLEIKGVYFLKARNIKITTDKSGFIITKK